MAEVDTAASRGRSFAEKFQRLARARRAAGLGPAGVKAMSRILRERFGIRISERVLYALYTGAATNPRLRQIEAVATFFGVPPSYFLDDAVTARLEPDLHLLPLLGDERLRLLVRLAAGLSADSLDPLLASLARLRHLEGLPAVTDPGDPPAPPAPRPLVPTTTPTPD